MNIPHGVAVVNGKGGVCKTSLATHVAGGAGLAGWKTLVVDTDPQGNARRDFGVETDNGLSFKNAVVLGDASHLEIVNVRPNVDLLAGGYELRDAWDLKQAGLANRPEVIFDLGELLAPVADEYDLVVFDTPPASGGFAPNTVMATVGNLIIPTMTDAASLDGIETLAKTIGRCREWNPSLGVLGVVMYGVEKRATAQLRKKITEVETMLEGTGIGVLGMIRAASRKATDDLRDMGKLAHEYELAAIEAAETAVPWYKAKATGGAKSQTYSKAAAGLAEDYQVVVSAILSAIVESVNDEQVIDLTDDSVAVAS